MKKYSKSAHATMHELNITPLLDLAFVLLVIFIITTAPPVEDKVTLPESTPKPKDPPQEANYVSIDASGDISLNRDKVNLEGLYKSLVEMRTKDPDLNIIVRGESKLKAHNGSMVVDYCGGAGDLQDKSVIAGIAITRRTKEIMNDEV